MSSTRFLVGAYFHLGLVLAVGATGAIVAASGRPDECRRRVRVSTVFICDVAECAIQMADGTSAIVPAPVTTGEFLCRP